MPERAPVFPVSRAHLDVLTDDVGIMQHAIGSQPDPAHGYCTDDVARALQVDLLHQRELGWDAVAASAWRSVRFLDEAFDRESGRFRNFRHIDGSWLPGVASEDSQGRAMLGLGSAISLATDDSLVERALSIFTLALPATLGMRALRARSSVLLACDAVMSAAPSERTATAYGSLADDLMSRLSNTSADWRWPEARLTYENALPPRALIVASQFLHSPAMLDAGLTILDWLAAVQTAPAGHLSPIGNGWWPRGGPRSQFDQQPIEATALMLAADSAYTATGDDVYPEIMERAYAWFLGRNDVQLALAVPEQGACFDGLKPTSVNRNQGAESTLMWLIALEGIRALRQGGRGARSGSGSRQVVAAR